MNEPIHRKSANHDLTETDLRILRAVREVAFGSVEITIHNSRVVQVERREKIRMPQDSGSQQPSRD